MEKEEEVDSMITHHPSVWIAAGKGAVSNCELELYSMIPVATSCKNNWIEI